MTLSCSNPVGFFDLFVFVFFFIKEITVFIMTMVTPRCMGGQILCVSLTSL